MYTGDFIDCFSYCNEPYTGIYYLIEDKDAEKYDINSTRTYN